MVPMKTTSFSSVDLAGWFLYKQAVAFDEYLKEKHIEHKSLVTGEGHTWMNARHYLSETVQMYWKESASPGVQIAYKMMKRYLRIEL